MERGREARGAGPGAAPAVRPPWRRRRRAVYKTAFGALPVRVARFRSQLYRFQVDRDRCEVRRRRRRSPLLLVITTERPSGRGECCYAGGDGALLAAGAESAAQAALRPLLTQRVAALTVGGAGAAVSRATPPRRGRGRSDDRAGADVVRLVKVLRVRLRGHVDPRLTSRQATGSHVMVALAHPTLPACPCPTPPSAATARGTRDLRGAATLTGRCRRRRRRERARADRKL